MRAKISNPDAGVKGLRPDLYEADQSWLAGEALWEAKRIMRETEWGFVPADARALDNMAAGIAWFLREDWLPAVYR